MYPYIVFLEVALEFCTQQTHPGTSPSKLHTERGREMRNEAFIEE